jgi:dTDP-glucose 4,6-dehydratase
MESVLVTGGAGFIGSNIVDALLDKNFNVVVLDDLSTGRRENIDHHLNNSGFTFYQGSILNTGLVRDIMRRHDITRISHQAAVASVTKCIQDPVATAEVNIIGTINIFEIAREQGCTRIVFASSCAIYGDTKRLPIVESVPVNAKSPYAAAKASDELMAEVFRGLYGTEIIALRYFNVFGKRQDPASDYAAVIPKFITLAMENKAIPIEGDGMQTRDFIYIDDVVQANIKALTRPAVTEPAFNVACGRETSIVELAKVIVETAGSRSEKVHLPPRSGDIKKSHADIGNARKNLGFSPEYTIEQGLRETVKWYREHGDNSKRTSRETEDGADSVRLSTENA